MVVSKKDLEIRIKISKAEKRAVNAVVKDLRVIRDAAKQVSAALNTIGAARIDSRRLGAISKAISGISVSVKNIKPSDAAGISKVAKALQQFKSLGSKDVKQIQDLTTQINLLTKAASVANIQVLATQLNSLNKSLKGLAKAATSLATAKTLLENIAKVRFNTTSEGVRAFSNSVVLLSRRFARNKVLIEDAIRIARSFRNAIGQAFEPQKLDPFEQKLRNVVAILDVALKKTAQIAGPVLGSTTAAVTTTIGGGSTGGGPTTPIPPTPTPKPPSDDGGGGITEKQLLKDAAALEKIIGQLDKVRQKAEQLNKQAGVFEKLGKGSDSFAGKLSTVAAKYDELASKAKALDGNLAKNADATAAAGIQYANLRATLAKTGHAAKATTTRSKELAIVMSRLATVMKLPVSFSQLLSQGFDKIAASQIKFLAASLVMYRGIQAIIEQFRKLLEISDRTAKAFAVSRSEIILLDDRYAKLQSTIEETTARTGVSIKDVSEILFQFGSAGLQAEESFAALDSTLKLIIATDASVTLTTKTVAATYRLLGDTLDNVGGKAEKFARINDVIAATYRDNQVEINELTQAYKFAIPVAKQLRLSFEETTGIIATLQNNMIRAGEAGRSMRAIFSRIASQADQFSESFGIAIDPTKPLDFLDLLEQVNARMSDGSLTADQVGIVFERLGLRGANSFLILTQNIDDVHDAINRLETDSQGAAEQMANIRLESASGQVRIFGENISKLIREGLTPLLGMALFVIRIFNKLAAAMNDTPVKILVSAMSVLLVAMGLLKIVIIANTLVTGALAASKIRLIEAEIMVTAAAETEALALQAASAAKGADLAATEALAQANINLAVAQKAAGVSAKSTGAAFFAAGLVALKWIAIIAAVIAVLLIWINKNKIAVWWHDRTLDKLGTEVKERKKQQKAIDEVIKKIDELSRAQEHGLATTQDVSNAIAEAADKHESLAISAALASGNVKEFIRLAKLEKEILDQAITDANIERQELFRNNILEGTKALKEQIESLKFYKAVLQTYIEAKEKGGILGGILFDEKGFERTKYIVKGYLDEIKNIVSKHGKRTEKNKDILKNVIGELSEFKAIRDEFYKSSGASKELGDSFVRLRQQARNIEDIDFSKQLDQLVSLGGASAKGIKGLAQAALFDFEIPFPESKLKNTIELINEELKTIDAIELQVEGGLDLYEEIAKGEHDYILGLDKAKAVELGRFFGSTFIGSLNEQISKSDFDPMLMFAGKEGEEDLFDIEVIVGGVAEQVELLRKSEDALKNAREIRKDIKIQDKEINALHDKLIDKVNKTVYLRQQDVLKSKKGYEELIEIAGDGVRARKLIDETFDPGNRIRLYNLIVEATAKASIAAREFLFITSMSNALLLERGQINEDEVAVQNRRNLVLKGQFDQQKATYELAEEALAAVYQNIEAYTDATTQIDNWYEAAKNLAGATESLAKGMLSLLKTTERINISFAKSKLQIEDENRGIDSTIAKLRTQVEENRKIYGIKAVTRAGIDKANKALRIELDINQSIAKTELEQLASSGNKTELAAAHNAYKAKDLQLSRKIAEEERKAENALRDSAQAIEVLRSGDSNILELRYKISNSLIEEGRIIAKIADKTEDRATLGKLYLVTQDKIAKSSEKIRKIEERFGSKSARANRIRATEAAKLNRTKKLDAEYGRVIAQLSDDILASETKVNKVIHGRVSAQRDLVATTFEYRDSVYETLRAFDDIRLSVLGTIGLENSRLARQVQLNRHALEFVKIQNKRRQLVKEIEKLSKADFSNAKISEVLQKRVNELAVNYADVLQKILETHKQISEEMENQTLDISTRQTSIYEKQLDILSDITGKIKDTLTEEISFGFDKRPFTEMMGAASLLGKSLFDIEKIGTDETIRLLALGFQDGSIAADNFTGKMRSAVEALREMNLQQQRLIEAQNTLQKMRYELSIKRFSKAFAAGDFDKALEALGEMENAAEVLNKVTGERDPGRTTGRLLASVDAAQMLADAMKDARKEEDSFDVYAQAQTLLDDINKLTSSIFSNIGGAKFSVEFLQQLEDIEGKFKRLSGITALIGKFETEVPEIQEQTDARLLASRIALPVIEEMPTDIAVKTSVDAVKESVDAVKTSVRDVTRSVRDGFSNVVNKLLETSTPIKTSVDKVDESIQHRFMLSAKEYNDTNIAAEYIRQDLLKQISKLTSSTELFINENIIVLRSVLAAFEAIQKDKQKESAVAGYATGGFVGGTGNGDIIPAMLEPGEFVIPRGVVDKLGVRYFNNLIRNESEGFKFGGIVGMQEGGEVAEQSVVSQANVIEKGLYYLGDVLSKSIEGYKILGQVINDKVFSVESEGVEGTLLAPLEYDTAQLLTENLTNEFSIFKQHGEFDLERLSEESPELVNAIADITSVVYDYQTAEERSVLLTRERANQLEWLLVSSQSLANTMNGFNDELEFLRQSSGDLTRANKGLISVIESSVVENISDTADPSDASDALLQISEQYAKGISEVLKQDISPNAVILTAEKVDFKGEVTLQESKIAGYQTGGFVGGFGNGDIIPAMLEPGEYVIPRNVVDKMGVGFFTKLISREKSGYKYGGLVGMQEGGIVNESVSQANVLEKGLYYLGDVLNKSIEGYKIFGQVIKDKVFSVESEGVEGTLLAQQEYDTAQFMFENLENEASIFKQSGEFDLEKLSKESPELVAAIADMKSVIYDYQTAEERSILLTRERANQLEWILVSSQSLANTMNGFNDDLEFLRQSSGDLTRANKGLISVIESSVVESIPDTADPSVSGESSIQISEQFAKDLSEVLSQGISADAIVLKADKVDFEGSVALQEQRIAGYQGGGKVPGSGIGDKVPALLEAGEFVIPKRVVEELGPSFFERIRHMRSGGAVGIARYQQGTPAGGASALLFDVDDQGTKSIITLLDSILKSLNKTQGILLKSMSSVIVKLEKMVPKEIPQGPGTAAGAGPSASVGVDDINERTKETIELAAATQDVTDSKKEQITEAERAAQIEKKLIADAAAYQDEAIDKHKTWADLWESLGGESKGALDKISGAFGKFQDQIHSSNKDIKALIKTIIGPFAKGISTALKTISEQFKDLFVNTIPSLISSFVDGVLIANATVEADYRRSLDDISDSYNDQRSDLVEQLKRNEISYFDYFNKLEDLQHGSADDRNSIEADRLKALEDNINETFGQIAQGLSGLVSDVVSEFGGLFNKVVDGATNLLKSLEPIFETIGAGIGVAIETAVGVIGGAGLAGALGGALGGVAGSIVPGAGTAAGAGIGLAIGAGVGGALGEVFSSVIPIVGDIAKVFSDILTSMVEGAAQLIPVLIDLATLPAEEFASLFGGTYERTDATTGEQIQEEVLFEDSFVGELPQVIADMGDQLIERLGVIAERLPDIIPDIVGAFLDLVTPSEEGAKSVITAVVDTMLAIMPTIATELIKVLNALSASLPDIFIGIFESIVETVRTVLSNPEEIKTAMRNVIDGITNVILSAESDFVEPMTEILGDVLPGIITDSAKKFKEVAPDIIIALADALENSIIFLTDIAVVIIKAITDILTDPAVISAITHAFLKIVFAVVNSLTELIPGLDIFLGVLSNVAIAIFAISTIINTVLLVAFAPFILAIGAFIAPLVILGTVLTLVLGPLLVALGKFFVIEPLINLFNSFVKTFEVIEKKLAGSTKLQSALTKLFDAFDKLGAVLFGVQDSSETMDGLVKIVILLAEVSVPLIEALTWIVKITTAWAEALQVAADWLRPLREAILGVGRAIWGDSLGPDLLKLLDVIILFTTPLAVLTTIFSTMMTIFTDLATLITTTLMTAFNSITTFVQGIIDMVPDLPGGPEAALETAGNATGSLVDTGKDIYNATLGQVFGTLHQGGVFPTDVDTTNVRALAADEGIAVLRAGEGVLTQAGVEAIGGSAAVDAANGGADVFTAIPPKALQSADSTFGESNAGFGVQPSLTEQGGTVGEETTINVDVTFDNCQFNGEDVADVVEENLAEKLQNRDGVVYSEIKKQKSDDNPGIRKR